jgi:SP family sugar:H+ symporter-like MFS transporter
MGKLSKFKAQLPFGRTSQSDTEGSQSEKQKYVGPYDNTPIPRVTIHSFIMGVFVSMGGFIFGYDTGQISGFLGMAEFQQRFGQRSSDLVTNPSGYYFSNVRSGLIVALVSTFTSFSV